ncbi:MAG: metal ABC transporter permease [Patescibacteria group bacterium]
MLEILQYPFIQRAFIAGMVLAVVLSFLGIFIILRRMAFFADGIAHASLSGIAVGIVFAFNPILTAVILTAFFAVIIYYLEKKFKLTSDVAIGILFTSGMALGVLLISLSPGYQPELMSFLFGNILSITINELWILIGVSLGVIAFLALYLKQITLMSFDKESAYLAGIKVEALHLVLYVITAVAVVLGIKVLGIILVSALVIMPVAIAKLFARSFKALIWQSIFISLLMVVAGLLISVFLDWPTGPTIVLSGTLLFILSGGWKGLKNGL